MDNSLFFSNVELAQEKQYLIQMFEEFSERNSTQLYVINAPLGTGKSSNYDYEEGIVVLIPKRKICIVNLNEDKEEMFEDFVEDFVEDLGYLSEKYDYKEQLGRPRVWKKKLVISIKESEIKDIDTILESTELDDDIDKRNADFLISLLIGSINDIARAGGEYPETVLDQVKKKIILFDGDQSRFIYSQPVMKKRVTIQGLAGTGKTELLLHKLKDLYMQDKNVRIVFTCFNKILAQSMRNRIPEFFDFMRVEEQIKWNERLWVMPSWGSRGLANTGVYSYICSNYNLEFHTYSYRWQFDAVCKAAIEELRTKEIVIPCFDYILIDESQDFPQSFFELCEMVTQYTVYIAGDIFQDIYDRTINQAVSSDYLLNKCYRTDPKTLMFAHAVGMGLYEKPVIRWLEDEEWKSCGYLINRNEESFTLSRVPLRRFEDLDMTESNSIKVIGSEEDDIEKKVYEIIDAIKAEHVTVQPGDIAIVFLEGSSRANYVLADYLASEIPKRYSWKVVKGYETKKSTSDAVFISNRNNIKGLEFPFVICIVRSSITDNVFFRNTIYMMLTRSFISSYFLVNNVNENFIKTYQNAADMICNTGVMSLREPPDDEKQQQNQKVSIAVAKKQRPIKEIIEEIIAEHPQLTTQHKKWVMENMMNFISEEGLMTEYEIQERTRKMISAYI